MEWLVAGWFFGASNPEGFLLLFLEIFFPHHLHLTLLDFLVKLVFLLVLKVSFFHFVFTFLDWSMEWTFKIDVDFVM